MNCADGELLVFSLLGNSMAHSVWCLAKNTWSSIRKGYVGPWLKESPESWLSVY